MKYVPMSWCDVLYGVKKKGAPTLPSGLYDCDGFWDGQQRRVFIRLYDKDGVYMCTLGQKFTNMVYQVLDAEGYEGCLGGLLESEQKASALVEQVED